MTLLSNHFHAQLRHYLFVQSAFCQKYGIHLFHIFCIYCVPVLYFIFFRGSWFEYAFAANQLGAMYSEDLNIYALSVTYILKASLYSGFCIRKWGKLQ